MTLGFASPYPQRKNQTDHRETTPLFPLRYLLAFVPVVAFGARKLLIKAGMPSDEVESVERAWIRALRLHVTLWARPYTKEGLW
jgi:hypothetical protein